MESESERNLIKQVIVKFGMALTIQVESYVDKRSVAVDDVQQLWNRPLRIPDEIDLKILTKVE